MTSTCQLVKGIFNEYCLPGFILFCWPDNVEAFGGRGPVEVQRYDGWYNNLAHSDWGSVGKTIFPFSFCIFPTRQEGPLDKKVHGEIRICLHHSKAFFDIIRVLQCNNYIIPKHIIGKKTVMGMFVEYYRLCRDSVAAAKTSKTRVS